MRCSEKAVGVLTSTVFLYILYYCVTSDDLWVDDDDEDDFII